MTAAPPRYCTACGSALPPAAETCRACGAPVRRVATPVEDVQALAALMRVAEEWRRQGLLDEASAHRVREHLEARLRALLPAPEPAAPPAWAAPAVPAPPLSASVATWAAERQADILLYLGAFLLVVAAVIFVTYQGEALGPAVRVAVLATYTIAFIVAGLAVRRWALVREAGRVFLALGALSTPLNFVLLHVEILDDRGVSADVVWLLGSAYTAVFYAALGLRGFGVLYRLLAGVAALSAWAALASVLGIPIEWAGAWFMALATAAVCFLAAARRLTVPALATAGLIAVPALLFASLAAGTDAYHWQLTTTCGLFALGVAVAGVDRRWPAALPVAATAVVATALAALWDAGVERSWAAYPLLAAGVAALATRRWWAGWSEALARFGWAYAAATALTPVVVFAEAGPNWHAVVAYLAGAAILAAVAWLDTRPGILRMYEDDNVTPTIERAAFGWTAFLMLLGAAGHLNQRLGIEQPDTGWAFLALSLAPIAALGVLAARRPLWEGLLLPPALVSLLVAMQPTDLYPGHDAVMLAAAAVALAAAAAWARRWPSLLVAVLLAGAAAAAAWAALDWPAWTLAAAYTAAGIAVFAALTPVRRYGAATDAEVAAVAPIVALSWAGAVAGPLTAGLALQLRLDADPLLVATRTAEYRTLIVLVLALAPLIAFEGWRLRAPRAYLAATVVVLVAALMAIGLAEPENVQAYTIPVALYLIALGIVIRRSPAAWDPHLYLHEALQVAGAATLVLPQAEQSFDPGGAVWGFVLIGEGAIFLLVAFTLAARWMAVAGVLTLSGVAVRWLGESGETVPYWLTLGIAGLVLLLLGFLLLLRHDWWTDVRRRTARWWQEAPRHPA